MLNLLWKDLRVGRVFVTFLTVMFLLGAGLASVGRGAVVFWFSLIFAVTAVMGMSQLDWRFGADRFLHSLPVSRRLVVQARYLWALVAGAGALLLTAALGLALGLSQSGAGRDWPRWVSADVALAWTLLYAIVVAIYLACYFTWGHGKGYIIGSLVIAGGILASGFLSQFSGGAVPADGVPRGSLVALVLDASARWGVLSAAVAVLATSALVLAVSLEVASRAYARREF